MKLIRGSDFFEAMTKLAEAMHHLEALVLARRDRRVIGGDGIADKVLKK